ncbi:unnamed protein product [Sphenostylis stenocarpa]|uniref:Uncharacterized protein n=1 Tax=Sphenostylis stenocarpa TaxID=92480 RepID=A0AA86SBJ8_9FABA|nr:unnamed protein product [Sphenostylis stenocarpa]
MCEGDGKNDIMQAHVLGHKMTEYTEEEKDMVGENRSNVSVQSRCDVRASALTARDIELEQRRIAERRGPNVTQQTEPVSGCCPDDANINIFGCVDRCLHARAVSHLSHSPYPTHPFVSMRASSP